MTFSDTWEMVLLSLVDVVAGAGLIPLLIWCFSSLPFLPSLVCGLGGLGLSLVVEFLQIGYHFNMPYVIEDIKLMVNFIVSMSLTLNLFSCLCPLEGKELSLIPLYVLLCISRNPLISFSGVVLTIANLIFAFTFLGFVSINPLLAQSFLGVEMTHRENAILDGFFLVVAVAYGCCSHMQPCYSKRQMNETKKYYSISSTREQYVIVFVTTLCRFFLFYAVSQCKSAFLSIFFAPIHQDLIHARSPNYLGVFYGLCLVVSLMHMASICFHRLHHYVNFLSSAAFSLRRIIRLQHILYAWLIAVAWIFPLQFSEPLVSLAGGCVLLQIILTIRAVMDTGV